LIESLNELFSIQKPKAVVLLFETGPISLGFINVCKKYNITTIGLQHGMITKFHKNYCHNKFRTPKEPYEFPLPNKLLLHGNITKKILEENNYPTDRLISIGNPAYFNLDKKEKILSNQLLFDKFQIDNKKKTILFLTSGIKRRSSSSSDIDYEAKIWMELLKNFGNDKNFQFILKPHPAEDPTKHRKILEENSFNNFQVIQGNLLELIFTSSLIVSTFSSSIFDALCMRKPVIQLDNEDTYSSPIDDYEDVVIKSSLSELSSNIRLVFSDSSIQTILLKNTINFISDAYNLPEKNPSDILKKIIN
jgi:CDP-glycerol glycerophosphotransferase (TagB/SpsB family)